MPLDTAWPCTNCSLDCKLKGDLTAIFSSSSPPASEDPDFLELASALVKTLGQLVQARRISTPEDLGVALAALFDLCVSLEYARLVTDTGWTYCPAGPGQKQPVLVYPFMKACPRCAASGKVVPVASHKPSSATIGRIASKTLGALLFALSDHNQKLWCVRQITRQIFDADFLLYTADVLALCEVKASPLVAFPLIATLEREMRRRGSEDRQEPITDHKKTDLPLGKAGEVCLYVPHTMQEFRLGDPSSDEYPLRKFCTLHARNTQDIMGIVEAWRQLYEGYTRKWNQPGDAKLRPLTFGCGVGVDDGKNSPGIDRTDDIKKGVYQMLKLGEHLKARCPKQVVKVALAANVHAVRHHADYLSGLEDVIWAHEQSLIQTDDPKWRRIRVEDLIRLYDAAITFTRPHFRDAELLSGFGLETLLARLGGATHVA